MSDLVDLVVVGVDGDIARSEMSDRLVKAFNQEAYSFEALLDGAYGESAPYAAQSGVERSLAEAGKDQLEGLGLNCAVVGVGEEPAVSQSAPSAVTFEDDDESAGGDSEVEETEALASFKSGEVESADETDADSEVEFDTDGLEGSDGALASFKKDTNESKEGEGAEVDFSNEFDSVGADNLSGGLADAKQSKNDVTAEDESLTHDFSDQLEDVGGHELSSGLKEGQQAKPDFDADVGSVDFSDEDFAVGIREDANAEKPDKKTKLDEEAAERDLASFPKEGVEDVDFSDELELLSTDGSEVEADSGVSELKDEEPQAEEDATDDEAEEQLQAELVDPAPAEKKDKKPVALDDGGLSLSTDDAAPLTAPKEKANPAAADDGGLSLSDDSSAPLTAPKAKTDPQSADDGGLSLDSDSSADAADTAASVIPDAADSEVQSAVTESEIPASDTSSAASESVPDKEPEAAKPVEQKPVEQKPVAAAPLVNDPPEETVAEAASASADASADTTVDASADTTVDATPAAGSGLVLPGQLSKSIVPQITPEEDLEDTASNATQSLSEALPPESAAASGNSADKQASEIVDEAIGKARSQSSKKKIVAALAGAVVLAGAGTFAFMNAGSIGGTTDTKNASVTKIEPVIDAPQVVEKMRVQVAEIKPGADLGNLSTGELLVNLSDSKNSNGILDLEPYFLESGDMVRRGPRIGAAVPAASEKMVAFKNRTPHPADKYFDDWSHRESDLSLFLALLDNLIEKGELDVAQQLSDRAKDKLFAVMSSQRLARAYSDVGQNDQVSRLMTLASRDTYSIKAPEERVLALSDFALTEQAIGLNEDAMDTFLKTSILARSLVKPEARTVGLSSVARYFQSSGRTKQAQQLLDESMQSGMELPKNTAARDLAIRYIALSEARMGLFNQALKNATTIVDPFATVSAYHGIALAIESTGDITNARKVLNMAYRAGSLIEDKDERSELLSKVVLASESD